MSENQKAPAERPDLVDVDGSRFLFVEVTR